MLGFSPRCSSGRDAVQHRLLYPLVFVTRPLSELSLMAAACGLRSSLSSDLLLFRDGFGFPHAGTVRVLSRCYLAVFRFRTAVGFLRSTSCHATDPSERSALGCGWDPRSQGEICIRSLPATVMVYPDSRPAPRPVGSSGGMSLRFLLLWDT